MAALENKCTLNSHCGSPCRYCEVQNACPCTHAWWSPIFPLELMLHWSQCLLVSARRPLSYLWGTMAPSSHFFLEHISFICHLVNSTCQLNAFSGGVFLPRRLGYTFLQGLAQALQHSSSHLVGRLVFPAQSWAQGGWDLPLLWLHSYVLTRSLE